MDVESIRQYCLSLPNTKEKLQWGETLCFKVQEKIFALLSLGLDSETRLIFKCSPEGLSELLEYEGVRRAPYVGRYNWAALERLDCLPDQQIRDLLGCSYAMIAAKNKRHGPARRTRKHHRN